MLALAMETRPEDVYTARFEDGHFHYGLIFHLPETADLETVRKYSRQPIRSRHGDVGQWTLSRDLPGLKEGECALLVPRSWLLRQGFLPLSVALCPSRRAPLRRWSELQRWFWLDTPASDRKSLPRAA